MPRVHDDISLGERRSRLLLPGLSLSEVSYAPDTEMPAHAHRNPNVTLVLQGGFAETVDGDTYDAYPGAVVFKPAGTVHANRFAAEPSRSFLVEFRGDFEAVYGHRVADFERCRWLAHGVSSGAALALYRLLRRHGDAAGADRARLPDVAVLGSLVARLFDVGQASPRHVPQERQAGWLRDARALLETDGEEPAMRDVARALGVHPVSLARRFRRQLACSPREYRQRWRVRRALALLATGAALPRVAQDAGFCDQSHLCRSFRRQLGMTPGAYRRLVGAA